MPMATKFLSESLSRNYLTTLPFAEAILGILLIIGLVTRFAAALLALLLVSFTIAVGMPAAMGQLGEQVKLPFHPNIVFLGMALALMLCGPGWISVDRMLFRPRRQLDLVRDVAEPPPVGP
jgi:uncharacterized membrane protein YphA (DoxX/SURF4 family)